MKKVLALVTVMVMVFTLCACGGSGSPATIVDNDGNTVQMTAEDLVSIYEENEANYTKNYQGAEAGYLTVRRWIFPAVRLRGNSGEEEVGCGCAWNEAWG